MGITIFKILIWEGISWDICSDHIPDDIPSQMKILNTVIPYMFAYLDLSLFDLKLYVPVNNFSVTSGQVFLG